MATQWQRLRGPSRPEARWSGHAIYQGGSHRHFEISIASDQARCEIDGAAGSRRRTRAGRRDSAPLLAREVRPDELVALPPEDLLEANMPLQGRAPGA